MDSDVCVICSGEGRITNAYGRSSSCPACHGSGRRGLDEPGIRDVTKTKPAHFRKESAAEQAKKQTWPATHQGAQLATEVKESALSDDAKTRLIREIIDYEGSHGQCTKTFTRKIRKQLRP
ncbi:MAG: molecular chaperone DnaJ [Myxococcales bacterium]|nr:molecular chaperone DnaJ [Myxococcales bacterium]MCB9581571.1 molecular chaperone DnaJ [Polyangiaceae bacterium]